MAKEMIKDFNSITQLSLNQKHVGKLFILKKVRDYYWYINDNEDYYSLLCSTSPLYSLPLLNPGFIMVATSYNEFMSKSKIMIFNHNFDFVLHDWDVLA